MPRHVPSSIPLYCIYGNRVHSSLNDSDGRQRTKTPKTAILAPQPLRLAQDDIPDIFRNRTIGQHASSIDRQ